MTNKNLNNFLNPKSIAIIGASNTEGKVGNSLMKNLKEFKGKVIPVNIHDKKVLGVKTYKSILEYKDKIDLVVIATPKETVNSILEECGKKGIASVIIITSGFSEVKNYDLEEQIIKTAKKCNINFLGPNCFGVANPYINLDTTFANKTAKKGNIAFISQSGALWSYISDVSSSDHIAFSGFVSLGNMAGLDFSDFIEYFSKDKTTKKIILYIEKLRDGKKFINACRKATKAGKEIIAIKAGKSEKGKEAAISHTGSLATDYEIYKGAFKQAGVKLAESFSEAFNLKHETLKVKGKKVFIITNAGGAGALMADFCDENGLTLVEPPEKLKLQNPLDILGTAKAEDYEKALSSVANENFYDLIIVILTPQKMAQPEETAEAIVKFSKQTKKQVIAYFLGEDSVKNAKKILQDSKIQVYENL